MSGSRKQRSVVLYAALAASIISLIALHLAYPLPYVFRVFVYQNSDFSDIHDFPARSIAASSSPRQLSVALDSRVVAVVEQHPQIERLETFLEETETSAFLVVHNGELVTEHYLRGHDRDSMQNTFSVSKSITSALVGLAIRDELISIDAPITQYLPELAERDQRFGEISIEDLLNMQSGIRYSQSVSFPFITRDDPLIYYHPDLAAVVLEKTTIAGTPGVEFQYNNYNPPLTGLILRRATGMTVADYLQQELWEPLGASNAAGWTVDDHGIERMESGFHASARDLARVGLLFLNRGYVAGQEVIPQDWVHASTGHADRMEMEQYTGRDWGYQSGWWIVPRAEGPPDFCAIGRYGQFIYVSPQYDAVFLRFGPGRGNWGDRDWTELFYFAAERL